MSINGSINLLKIKGARKILADGQKGIFIPAEDNPAIYVGKGAYLSIRVVEKETTFEDRHYTHFVAVALPKAKIEELKKVGATDNDIKELTPILGNLEEYVPNEGGGYEAVSTQELPRTEARPAPRAVATDPNDDLPF